MRVKIFALCTAFCILNFSVSAQSSNENLNKKIKDSTRKEQSGKADVYVLGKPIFDTGTIQKEKAIVKKVPPKKTSVKKKAKKNSRKAAHKRNKES